MSEHLKGRIIKLEHKIRPPPPSIDLVKLVQDTRRESTRLKLLSPEEFNTYVEESKTLIWSLNDQHAMIVKSAVASVQSERASEEYLESIGEERRQLMTSHIPAHGGVLSLIQNRDQASVSRASGKPQP